VTYHCTKLITIDLVSTATRKTHKSRACTRLNINKTKMIYIYTGKMLINGYDSYWIVFHKFSTRILKQQSMCIFL